MSEQTSLIIKAAKGWKTWGRYPALKFATRHGIDFRLIRLARQLESVKGF